VATRPLLDHRFPLAEGGELLRDTFARNSRQRNFRLFCPDEINSNRLGAVFEVENRCFVGPTIPNDDHVSHDGRVFEVLSEHLCEGWLEGYLLTGRHGLFASYEAFGMIAASMMVQPGECLAIEDSPVGGRAALAAGTEIVAVTTYLTRPKFRDTNLLDRSHIVDDPRTLPEVVHRLTGAAGKPSQSIYEGRVPEDAEEGPVV
jgi:hypothetical protein